MAAPQHPTPVGDNAPSSILEQALEASIAQQIRRHVEQGTEDLARKYFGDRAVDDWFRSIGWDPDVFRAEPVDPFALATDGSGAEADRQMDALVQAAREQHADVERERQFALRLAA